MELFGSTRSNRSDNHCLITPDTHVAAPHPGSTEVDVVTHISPQLGARFVQATMRIRPGGRIAPPAHGVERFLFVIEGQVALEADDRKHMLEAGGYAYLPADLEHAFTAASPARLVAFEKPFSEAGFPPPSLVVGHESHAPREAFQGDERALLQTLLPDDASYDMAVNVFTYEPGAHLPQVEIHEMEHGLLVLQGAGVYRLGNCWYPVGVGDVIWMASYCPQWFVAMGAEPARYIYYKDVNRDPIVGAFAG